MKPEAAFSLSSAAEAVQSVIDDGQDEPFYVVDVNDMLLKHKKWLINLPRVKPFYAVKCNSCPLVLELLAALGLGFDCASKVSLCLVPSCHAVS